MPEKTMKKEFHPIKKYEILLRKPQEFFKTVEKETDWQSIALFVGVYLFVGELLGYLAFLPIATETISLEMVKAGFLGIFSSPFITLLISLILAAAIHLGIRFYKQGQPFFSTFFPTWKVVAYASLVPIVYNVFLSIVNTVAEALNPFAEQSLLTPDRVWGGYSITITILFTIVGIIALIHTLYTEIIGVLEYHKLDRKQAAVAVLVPSLILFLLSIALMMVVGPLMG